MADLPDPHRLEVRRLPAQDGIDVVKTVLLDGRELFMPRESTVKIEVAAGEPTKVTFTVYAEVELVETGFYDDPPAGPGPDA